MNAQTIKVAGAGRAYQSVAQSTAIVIQDGADYLRNVSTISTTAIGIAMAMIAANQTQGNTLLTAAQKLVSKAASDFTAVSSAAIKVATDYPKSFT
jgi:hypothetical protein